MAGVDAQACLEMSGLDVVSHNSPPTYDGSDGSPLWWRVVDPGIWPDKRSGPLEEGSGFNSQGWSNLFGHLFALAGIFGVL